MFVLGKTGVPVDPCRNRQGWASLVGTKPNRTSQWLDVTAKGDHGEPQEQPTRRDQFRGERRILPAPEILNLAENASQIKCRCIHPEQ